MLYKKQGCPLSPIFYNLCLEVLAINIRANKDITGFNLGSTEVKIELFAEDVEFCLANPSKIISVLIHMIENFGDISNYTINIA